MTLTGPAKIMAEKWGETVVKAVPLWHHVTQGVFPIKDTLSTECLERCKCWKK